MANIKTDDIAEALRLVQTEQSDALVEELSSTLGETLSRVKGRLKPEVVSAVVLTDDEKMSLKYLLQSIFKREFAVNFKTDPSVLGGFLVRLGDWKLDASLRGQIANLQKNLRSTA